MCPSLPPPMRAPDLNTLFLLVRIWDQVNMKIRDIDEIYLVEDNLLLQRLAVLPDLVLLQARRAVIVQLEYEINCA